MGCIRGAIEEDILVNDSSADSFKVADIIQNDLDGIADSMDVKHVPARPRVETVIDRNLRPQLQASVGKIAADEAQTARNKDSPPFHLWHFKVNLLGNLPAFHYKRPSQEAVFLKNA